MNLVRAFVIFVVATLVNADDGMNVISICHVNALIEEFKVKFDLDHEGYKSQGVISLPEGEICNMQ